MKKIISIFCVLFLLYNCKNGQEINSMQPDKKYDLFGKNILLDNVLNEKKMLKKFKNMKVGDTLQVTFKSKITGVCQKKGCWMTMDLPQGEESSVRFKNYAFFVPKDATGKESIVKGKAYIKVVSVEDQRHHAEEEGKSLKEIDQITEPKSTYAIRAEGVLIERN